MVTHMSSREITVTAPDGESITIRVGAKRQVGAIRLMDVRKATGDFAAAGATWIDTVHKSLPNAITGPNQTPMWNRFPRVAIEIGADDQPVGDWVPASK